MPLRAQSGARHETQECHGTRTSVCRHHSRLRNFARSEPRPVCCRTCPLGRRPVPGTGHGSVTELERKCDGMSVRTGAPLLPTYARFPVTFVDGDGCWLIDEDGKRYLDLVAGIAVVGL